MENDNYMFFDYISVKMNPDNYKQPRDFSF